MSGLLKKHLPTFAMAMGWVICCNGPLWRNVASWTLFMVGLEWWVSRTIGDLQTDLEMLRKHLRIAITALNHYADKKTWHTEDINRTVLIDGLGGRNKALEALKAIRELT